ncbi:MAG: polyphosphate kinase 2 [Saprospiraceae bacterium]|nr:polyphosphate kinase 2 [Saprospiraceae bacterium]
MTRKQHKEKDVKIHNADVPEKVTKTKLELSAEDVAILNSKIGMKYLLADKKTNAEKALRLAQYELDLRILQAELIQLQNWTIRQGKKIVVIFEGRDAAGKGGAIRRITAHINPRHYRIVALRKPTPEEHGQWYFQRYVNQLPKPGEMVFFDRSWYNRAIVEPVNEFCTTSEYNIFMGQVNDFERMIVESGTYLIKIYLSITKTEQASRFEEIRNSRLKRWKMTPVDERAQELWDVYTAYKKKMFANSDTEVAPWTVIKADRKSEARIEVVEHLLRTIPYVRGEGES